MFSISKKDFVNPEEDLSDFYIYCFTCKERIYGKSKLKSSHLGHEVDWVRRRDGETYSKIVNANR